jgi:hypothetical protein
VGVGVKRYNNEEEQAEMLDLTAAGFQLTLEVLEPMILPPYKGSTLRGGFGTAFRKICCSQRQLEKCKDCLLKETCPYGFIFESSPPDGSELWGKFEEIPRPFIIEPPETAQTEFKVNEQISFNLVLIGKAIEYLPYFILVFKELGDIGIGRRRAKFKLIRVDSLNLAGEEDQVVYDGERVYNKFHTIQSVDVRKINHLHGAELTVAFKTMTRLKQAGEFTGTPVFSILIRSLLRRFSALQYFYCGARLDCDFSGMVERAETIKLIENETEWVDWERYSSRQNTRMKLGGLIGTAKYTGPWREFEEILRWGEIAHVGKGATFGLGKMEMEFLP